MRAIDLLGSTNDLHHALVSQWGIPVTVAAATLVAESTVTDRYQTTVPDSIRRVLKLGKRDRLRYSVQPDGAVILERVAPEDAEDPVLREFLAFLSRDIEAHPDRLKAFDGSLRERIQALVGRVDVDLDKPLSPQVVAGACFGATKTDVVCFSLERFLESMARIAIGQVRAAAIVL